MSSSSGVIGSALTFPTNGTRRAFADVAKYECFDERVKATLSELRQSTQG
jgi:hypothetical protein